MSSPMPLDAFMIPPSNVIVAPSAPAKLPDTLQDMGQCTVLTGREFDE